MRIITTFSLINIIKKLLLKLGFNNSSFYINGPETLPPPLTLSQENEIVARIGRGGEEEDKEIR